MDDLTPGERALIEKLRTGETFRIFIARRDDASINGVGGYPSWQVQTAPPLPAQHPQNSGGGGTFDQAWLMCTKAAER